MKVGKVRKGAEDKFWVTKIVLFPFSFGFETDDFTLGDANVC